MAEHKEHANRMALKYAKVQGIPHVLFEEFAMAVLEEIAPFATGEIMCVKCKDIGGRFCERLRLNPEEATGAAVEIWITRYLGNMGLEAFLDLGKLVGMVNNLANA